MVLSRGQWWAPGRGGHGYVGATRWWNAKHPNTYAQMLAGATLPEAGFEQLGTDALHTEDVLLKTRLRQGLPLARLGAAERERAEAVVADGLLVPDGDTLVLTPADGCSPTQSCAPCWASGLSGHAREPVSDEAGDLDIERDSDRDVVGKRQTQ
jgi:coproporphyrinogen III oxidase-like Fe-S oxidoreductase